MPGLNKPRRQGLIWVLLCAGISITWGTQIARNNSAWIDFRSVYAGARTLLHHRDPYTVAQVAREYASEDGQRPAPTPDDFQAVTLQVNLPTTYALLAPLAALSWRPAHILWMLLTGCLFTLAILLMWNSGARYAPRLATLLACVFAINCQTIFAGANTAGIVVALCAIAVWCFLENRFVQLGVLCLALSLAVKPHDSGFIWLYFVLVGGGFRKRAAQSLAITAVIGLGAALWLSSVAPHWMHDWRHNLATISAPGGINDPSPNGVITKDHSLYSLVDLQSAVSIFRDDPYIYNTVSYLLCGVLLLAWMWITIRTGFSARSAWLAFAVTAALSMLIGYHRLWDAKLLMLAVPATCLLWSEGGRSGKAALFVTSIAILATGALSLVTFQVFLRALYSGSTSTLPPAIRVVLTRPASLALLAMGIFYLWAYVRQGHRSARVPSTIQEVNHA